jgi:hypothetical protein
MRLVLWILDDGLIYTYLLFFCKYIHILETPRSNTNRHVHAHKCLHCAGIEPATSCVAGEYSHHYDKSAVLCSTISSYFSFTVKKLNNPFETPPLDNTLALKITHLHFTLVRITVEGLALSNIPNQICRVNSTSRYTLAVRY